jgi:hypothetical protein
LVLIIVSGREFGRKLTKFVAQRRIRTKRTFNSMKKTKYNKLKNSDMNKAKIIITSALAVASIVSCNSRNKTYTTDYDNKTQQEGKRGGAPSIDEIFEMDANQDGKLSKTEAKGPLLKDFDKIDTDKDGFLSREEVENAPKPSGGRPPQGGGPR